MRLAADPEGFVPTDLAGVALGANVSLAEAREAMAFLEASDPDADLEDPDQGRVVSRIVGGWQVLGFEEDRERAKAEAQKARNRRYMKRARAAARAANDTPVDPTVDAIEPDVERNTGEVDQPKPIPKSKTHSSEGMDPPYPPSGTVPVVLHRMPDNWRPSDELRAEAKAQGVRDLDSHIARLRLGPIGGNRGVLSDQIDDYVRLMLPKMRTWDESDRAKAARAAAQPSIGSYGQRQAMLEPNERHRQFADNFGIDLDAIVRDLNLQRACDALGMVGAQKELEKRLAKRARDRRGAA